MAKEQQHIVCPFCGKTLVTMQENGPHIKVPAGNAEKRGGSSYVSHNSNVDHDITVELEVIG